MPDDNAGGSQVIVYLSEVTQEQIERLVDDIADVVAAHGFATDPGGDEDVRSVVSVRAFAWPDGPDDMIAGHLADAAMFVIPLRDAPRLRGYGPPDT